MITLKPRFKAWSEIITLNEEAKESNNINVQNSDGNTMLHLATLWGDLDTIKALQLKGAKCIKNNLGHTPLFLAVQLSAIEIIQNYLATWPLEDILIKDKFDRNAMIAAINSLKTTEVFKCFLADSRLNNAQLSMNKFSRSPLMLAVDKNLIEVVKLFLQYWSTDNILATDYEERNILHKAAQNGNVEIIKILLSDPHIKQKVKDKDIYGQTPLDIAAGNKDDESIKVLCDDPNVDPQSIIGYGKPLAELDQASIEDQLTAYMALYNLKAQDALGNLGNCNAFGFLYQIYLTATGSDTYFYTLLNEIKTWDGKESSLNETILPPILKKNFPNKKAIFEEMIHHIVIFQALTKASVDLQLGFNQETRKQQYSLIKDPNLNRTLKDIFFFSLGAYNKQQLEEIINIFSHWPRLSIDFKSVDHSMTLYITENGNLQFYDSNAKNKILPFHDAKHLINHMIKFYYKPNNKFNHDKLIIMFHGFKFYNRNEIIPNLLPPKAELSAPINSANKWNVLHYAIMENNIPKIKQLLQTTGDLSLKDAHHNTPLRMAVRFRNEAAIELILKKLVLQGSNNSQIGLSLNFEELLKLKPKFVLSLIENGFLTINTKDITGSTLLQTVAYLQDPKMLNTIIQVKDLDINLADNDGSNALMIAMGYPLSTEIDAQEETKESESEEESNEEKISHNPIHLESIKNLILRKDLDINAQDNDGKTALMIALQLKLDINLISLILNREDLNINQTDKTYGANALMCALASGADTKTIEQLLAKGAQVQDENINGENSLMYAVSYGASYDTVKLLLHTEALNINSIDKVLHRNILMFALESDCSKDIIKLLLEKGVSLDHKDEAGETAFDYAEDKPEITELLYEFQMKNHAKSDSNRKSMRFSKTTDKPIDNSKAEVGQDNKITKKY